MGVGQVFQQELSGEGRQIRGRHVLKQKFQIRALLFGCLGQSRFQFGAILAGENKASLQSTEWRILTRARRSDEEADHRGE